MTEDSTVRFGEITTRTTVDEFGNERIEEVVVGIPQCCREGWDSCPHVIKTERKRIRKNVGL